MVKRILKIVGIILLAFVVVTGGAVGIFALTGGFKEENIPITNLYFDVDEAGNQIRSKQIQTLNDIVQNIKYEPANATNTELEVTVSDSYNILSNDPTKVTAGKDFTLKLNRDSKGNNVGGFATLQFKAGLVWVDLTVFVDMAIPDNALFFTGDMDSKVTPSGKTFSMPISDTTQYIYLNSQLINSFDLKVNNENIKNVQIGYDYYYKNSTISDPNETKVFEKGELSPEPFLNEVSGYYDSFYKIPIVTKNAGSVKVWAKMHRTAEIEKAFVAGGFDEIVTVMKNSGNSTVDKEKSILLLNKYNAFLNTYIEYFDTSDQSYTFFQNSMMTPGTISLKTLNEVQESLNYVFVNTSATIEVEAIKLSDFTSINSQRVVDEYEVFKTVSYSVSGVDATSIKSAFDLEIITDNMAAPGVDTETDYMFESLKVSPYIYVGSDVATLTTDDNGVDVVEWAGKMYSDYRVVYGFNIHTPLFYGQEETGYLIRLIEDSEFISVSEAVSAGGEKIWNITPNVPMQNDQTTGENIKKALYLGFEVKGISPENKQITKEALTRVYVNYVDYLFTSNDVHNLVIDDLCSHMTINTNEISINESSEYELPEGRYVQDVRVNIDDFVTNYDEATYTNVMYFVEKGSNTIGTTSQKVAAVGTYKFLNYANVINPNLDKNKHYYLFGPDSKALEGQRIPTFNVDSNGKRTYYLHALNADTTEGGEVKVFAVVYLSNKDGKPIDINGRVIDFDETSLGNNIPELVVMRISDITDGVMPEVRIDSFVENINFYTKSENAIEKVFTFQDESKKEYTIKFDGSFVNRNAINKFEVGANDTAIAVDSDTLADIQNYLKLKLLKNNAITLYATNFDLDATGKEIKTQASETVSQDIICTDFFGKTITITRAIDVDNNKMQAFNNFIADVNNIIMQTTSGVVEVKNNGKGRVVEGDGVATTIAWDIVSKADDGSGVISLNMSDATMPYGSVIPYTSSSSNSQLARNNFVAFEAHKLDVYDVILNTNIVNSIIARYSASSDGGLVHTLRNAEGEIYKLVLTNGNLQFDVLTNLVSYVNNQPTDNVAIDNLNANIIDLSQMRWSVSDYDEKTPVDDKFVSIKQYINYFVKNSLNTQLQYSGTQGMISFVSDAEFSNEKSDGTFDNKYIYFGNQTFVFDAEGQEGPTVEIGGYKIALENSGQKYFFVIEQDSYFPMINGDKALIYNTIFDINSGSGNTVHYIDPNNRGERQYFVNKNATVKIMNNEGQIEDIDYDVNNYVKNTDDNILSQVVDFQGELVPNEYTVNFKYGEEVWKYIPVEQKKVDTVSGEYYVRVTTEGERYSYVRANGLQLGNSSIQKYKLINYDESNYVEESKKEFGVKVYLMITFPIINSGESSEFVFYKAIEFEVHQNRFNISINDNDELNNQTRLVAGATNCIGLNDTNVSAINIYPGCDEPNFFQHVSFSIESPSIKGIESEAVITEKKLNISIPDTASKVSFTLVMTYEYKGKLQTKKFGMVAEPNITISINTENVTEEIGEDEKYYVINLNSGDSLTIFNKDGDISTNLFTYLSEKNYFSVSDNVIGVSLVGVTGSQLQLGNAYSEYDGSIITGDKLEYEVKFTIGTDPNDKTITWDYKLKIIINPEYVMDLTEIDNETPYIFNGENIFGSLIKLYNPSDTPASLESADLTKYPYVFDFNVDYQTTGTRELMEEDEKLTVTNGVVKLTETPVNDTLLTLKFKYTELGIDKYVTVNLYVRGVQLQLSNGATKVDNQIVVEIEEGQALSLDTYLSCVLDANTLDTTAESYILLPIMYENSVDIIDQSYDVGFDASELSVGTYTYKLAYGMFVNNKIQPIEFITNASGEILTIKIVVKSHGA